MLTKNVLYLFFAFSLFTFSCSSDEGVDCDGSNYESELQSEINAIANAAISYSSDPTSSNCNAFKNAYQDFIDGLRPYRNCNFNGQSKATFDAELDAAEQAIDQLSC